MANQPCYECGKIVDQTAMIQYSGSWICADCKPAFMQKLKEGVGVTGSLHYAGFWIRFAAKFVDGIILNIVNYILGMVLITPILGAPTQTGPAGATVAMGVLFTTIGIQFAVQIAYSTYFVGKFGATPGKMACKLKVVTPDGGNVSYTVALGRCFAEILSSLVFLIGYIMAAFDEEKRALHDRICGTRVVYSQNPQ